MTCFRAWWKTAFIDKSPGCFRLCGRRPKAVIGRLDKPGDLCYTEFILSGEVVCVKRCIVLSGGVRP